MSAEVLRERILALVQEYHSVAWPERPFVPGVTPVPVSGRTFDAADVQNLVAMGVSQLAKLDELIARRNANFNWLLERLAGLEDCLILPTSLPGTQPRWFGFPLSVRPGAPLCRNQVVIALNKAKVGTWLLFGGNLLRQPAFRGTPRRVVGSLSACDFIMERTFWLGVYPELTAAMLPYVGDTLEDLFRKGR